MYYMEIYKIDIIGIIEGLVLMVLIDIYLLW